MLACGISTSEEQSTVTVSTPQQSDEICKAFISGIKELDVNAHKGSSRPFGWTKESYDYLAVTVGDLLEASRSYLTEDQRKILCMDRTPEQNRKHKELETIVDAFSTKDLIWLEKENVKTESGSFIIKAGTKKFTNVLLLNKPRLQQVMPETVTAWGNSQYAIKVVKEFAPAG